MALMFWHSKVLAQESSAASPSVEPELIAELIAWIEANSDYDATSLHSHLPSIEFCQCGDTIQYEGETIVVQEHLKGLYDKPNRKIILVQPWDADNIYHVSILLHELIHFVQYSTKYWTCWNQTEWDAYKLQESWLLTHGHDPKFDWMRIFFLAHCPLRDPREIHPFQHF